MTLPRAWQPFAVPAQLQDALRSLHATTDDAQTAANVVAAHVDELLRERARIAEILATFYRAELSMSSVQPVLDLAVELTPSLRRRDKVLS